MQTITSSQTGALAAPGIPEELFTATDLDQLKGLGIGEDEARRQIELFRNPPPFTRVVRACTPGDGIQVISASDHGRLLGLQEEAALQGRIGKVVPASGAASRMFKGLLEDLHGRPAEPSAEVCEVLDNLPRFAFFEDLAAVMRRDGLDLDTALRRGERWSVLEYLLTGKGLAYAELPKAVLQFHRSPDGSRTPLEEHLAEAADCTRDIRRICRLHFTVSPDHEERMRRLLVERCRRRSSRRRRSIPRIRSSR